MNDNLSSNKWIDYGIIGEQSSMNVPIALKFEGVNDLALLSVNPPVEHVVFGDYTKWCANLLFFPFKTTLGMETPSKLVVGGATTDINAYQLNTYYEFGFTLGEYKYDRIYNDFRDFEPYTKLQIYLPFYSFVDIPVADVIDKYIQFRFFVDFLTGQAVYMIGVSNTSITSPNKPFYIGTDDTDTRIIGTYTFQIGASIPLGQTGMADMIRNVSLSSLKTLGGIGATAISEMAGGYQSTTKTQTVKTTSKINKKGDMKPSSVVTTETNRTYDNNNYAIQKNVSTAFEGAIDSLNSMQLSAHTGNSNNILIDSYGSKSIKIVRKTAKVVNIANDYGHLYGFPLGEVRTLNDLTGYTEITNIHLESDGFKTATQKEKLQLEQILSQGIIL